MTNLKCLLLCDRSPSPKAVYCMVLLYDILAKVQLQRWKADQWRLGDDGKGSTINGSYEGIQEVRDGISL